MSDALVKELNRLGYQPVFLPRTGVTPPELYNFVRKSNHLVRRGPLRMYLPAHTQFDIKTADVGDIEHHATSGKNHSAALSFLKDALACIGIQGAPTLDLSFVEGSTLNFRVTEVTAQTVENMDFVLRQLKTGAIPEEYIDAGGLHVVYEYLYAKRLMMTRSDQHAFKSDLSVSIDRYIDLGGSGKVEVSSDTTLSFSSGSGDAVAFAFKVGQLVRDEGRWYFYPEERKMGGGAETTGNTRPMLLARGVVLDVQT